MKKLATRLLAGTRMHGPVPVTQFEEPASIPLSIIPNQPKETTKVKTTVRRGANLYPASNANVKKLVECLGPSKAAEAVGISSSFMATLANGSAVTSRTIDMASEGCLRRMGKGNEMAKHLIVARIKPPHWETIKAMITNLGGKILEVLSTDEVITNDGSMMSVFNINQQHAPAIEQLITVTGGHYKTAV